MLRGHAIGGSRRMNGHWQDGGGETLWGDWIFDITAGYVSETYINRATANMLYIPRTNFRKNKNIPTGLRTIGNYGFDCTWFRIKITATYDTEFISFRQRMRYNAPEPLQNQYVLSPVWSGHHYTDRYILNIGSSIGGHISICSDIYYDAAILHKGQQYIYDSSINIGADIIPILIDGYLMGQSIDFYAPLTDFYPGVVSPHVSPYSLLMERQNANFPQGGIPNDFNGLVQVKMVTLDEVIREAMIIS